MLQICENIKQARVSTGMNQTDFAEKLGKKRSTYAEWETNIVPDIEMLKKIAQAANTTLSKLLSEEIELKEGLPWQIIDRLSRGIENMTEANLLLAKKISSGESGSVSSPFQQEGISNRKDIEQLHLSGKIKPAVGAVKKAGRKGILKTVGK